MERHPLWWTAGATAAVAGAGLLVWWAQRWYDRGLAELVPAVQRPEPWVVDRPAEVSQVVAALRAARGTVGITTAVQGAGGFGKTTVAKMVRADPRVLRRFRGRVYWVTLGRDAGKEALAGLVNGLIAQIDPDRAVTFTDARQAAEHLAAMLANGPRRLLILDDVWTEEQLAAFPVAGRCARLVTTRIPSLAAGAGCAGPGGPDVRGAGAGAAAGRAAAAAARGRRGAAGGDRPVAAAAAAGQQDPRRPGRAPARMSPRLRRTCWAGCAQAGRCRSTS